MKLLIVLILASGVASNCLANDIEKESAALGHYSRARSLLMSALQEFEAGDKLSSSSALLDAKRWRSDIAGRAKDLEVVLSPRARESQRGVRYSPDARLLKSTK